MIFVLIISGVFWLHRLVKFIYNVCCYWEIRSFYINALKMTMVRQMKLYQEIMLNVLKIDFVGRFLIITKNRLIVLFNLYCASIFQSELPYATWQEVQARIVEIQKEHQICIHKKELTELDIYHRILRFKNYMVRCLFAELFMADIATCKHNETVHQSFLPAPL